MSLLQAVAALNGLALCTDAVLACGDIVVAGGGMPVLLGIVRLSARSKEAAEALRAALLCLTNISRSRWVGRREAARWAHVGLWQCQPSAVLLLTSWGRATAQRLPACLCGAPTAFTCRQHGGAVFEAEGLLHSLGDHLQQQREKEVRGEGE